MDLDFNQGGMPPTSPDNSTPPQPASQPLQQTPPAEAAVDSSSVTNFPSEQTTPSGQPLVNPINNIDVHASQPANQMPPPPPMPPIPAESDISGTDEQYIETPEDQPRKSLLWPILIVVILLMLIAGAISGWYAYSQKQNNQAVNTDSIGLDPATGLPFDNSASSTDTSGPSNSTVSNDLTTIKGRDSQRKDDLKMVQLFLEAYKAKNGAYPISPDASKLNEANTVVSALVPTYAPSLPSDPSGSSSYYGYTSVDGTSYKLTASLEDLTDPSGVKTGNYNILTITNLDLTNSTVTTNPQSDSINDDFSNSDTTSPTAN